MCSVSAVSDYYTNTYPGRLTPLPMPYPAKPFPGLADVSPARTIQSFDPEVREMMRKALILLDKIDKRLGDVECMDEAKAAFLKTLNLDPADISGG
jgi:hypothetical protein